MRSSRVRAFALVIAGMSLVFGSIPAEATNLAEVESKVSQLEEEAANAAEDYNQARSELDQVNRRISSLQNRSADQKVAYKALSRDLGTLVRNLYKTGGIDLDLQAMVATDPSAFLSHLDAISVVGSRQQATLRRMLAASVDMKQTAALLKSERLKAQKIAAKASTHMRTVNSKLDEAQKLLNTLQEKERKARAAKLREEARKQAKKAKKYSAKLTAVVSKRLRRVLSYALSQVGDDYRAAATGPSSYDCSGLTMMAYRQIGVGLSHYSGAQWSQTRRVSRSNLRPGDLVFFFRGIRHVGMYIGNNRFVHAASYRYGVIVSSLSESYYAARLSGFGRVIG